MTTPETGADPVQQPAEPPAEANAAEPAPQAESATK